MSSALEYDRIELEEAKHRLNKLVRFETRGFGDDVNALRRICRTYGLPYWTVERIKQNKVKKASGGVIRAIKEAYVSYCEAQVKVLQTEIAKEKAKYPDADLENLEIEAEELRARVRSEAERLRQQGA